MPRRRTVVLAALALCVPIPAFALSDGDAPPEAAGTLGVSASLDSCGIAGSSIVCKIDASWNSVEGATSYSANVTSPGGSVVDYGDAGGSGTSFWVPYTGPGTYTVQVSAYGDPPGPGKREVIARDSSGAGGHPNPLDDPGATSLEAQVGLDPAAGTDETDDDGSGEPAGEEPLPCEEDPPANPPVEEAAAEGNKGADELSAEDQAALEAQAELPESVDCPAPAPPG